MNEELRKALAKALQSAIPEPRGFAIRDVLDALLALPEVAALLADAERVRRVRELADEYERHAGLMQAQTDSGVRPDVVTRLQAFEDAAGSIRRALDEATR